MVTLRGYQERAVRHTRQHWDRGVRGVCLVSPTGSGKTSMGVALAAPYRSIWVAHRRELVIQAADRLRDDGLRVGVICPGYEPDHFAPIQVATIQTLLAREKTPDADLVVLDEAHHYSRSAKEWSAFADAYASSRLLGLTATPERQDGSPLGDVFDQLVVAATYSELMEAGHITKCDVFAPPPNHARGGWALDPVVAYQKHGQGMPGFAFFDRVARAQEWERNFNLAGIHARTISDKTPPDDRREILSALRAERVKMVCNVYTMTEGVDVPNAGVCILGRAIGHASMFIQMVGRILRPSPGKKNAILLDLVDATSQHGFPTEDREYALHGGVGGAITRTGSSELRTCPGCSCVFARILPQCPHCGWVPPIVAPPTIHIWNVGLRRHYAGADTADEHKHDEYVRLRAFAKRRDFGLGWVVREYEKLFHAKPPLADVTEDERRAEYDKLHRLGVARGFKPKFAAARYYSIFGGWPPRGWGQAS